VTNAFIMYERLYDEEKAKKNCMMPKKWSHLDFLSELILDLMGFQSNDAQINCDNDADHSVSSRNTRNSTATSSLARSSSSVSLKMSNHHKFDLATQNGREKFFQSVSPKLITSSRMNSSYIAACLDGNYHPLLAATTATAYCQYCKHK